MASVVAVVAPVGVMVTPCNGAPVSASFTVPDTVTTAAPPELLLLLFRTLLLPRLALLPPDAPLLDGSLTHEVESIATTALELHVERRLRSLQVLHDW